MSKFFIELYSEEIPSNIFDLIKIKFKEIMKNFFLNSNLVENIEEDFCKIYLTSCRIIFYTNILKDEILIKDRKIIAPKVDSPNDEINGFLKAFNLNSINELEIENDNYILLQKNIKIKTKEIIQNEIVDVLNDFLSLIPETIEWGNRYKWIAPLRNILCIFNEEVMNFNFCGINSNNYIYGNKILVGLDEKIEIKDFDDYQNKMNENYIMIDSNEREKVIINKLVEIQNKLNCSLFEIKGDENYYEDKLLNKIVNTTEFPNVFVGEFNNDFLKLPNIIITSIIYNKYNCFCLKNNSNNFLSNKFVLFANTSFNNKGKNIVSNFENNINKKLSMMDLELTKYMAENLEIKLNKLKLLPSYKDFGNVYDEIERLCDLSKFICLFLPHCDLISTEQAARLCKIDLTTSLVKNNFELRGYLSSYYAKVNNYSDEICNGIEEFYKPENLRDKIPSTDIGRSISLAGRLDNITTLFISNNESTGSKDPYGIRKTITSVIKIIIEGNINIPLNILIHKSISLFKTKVYKANNDMRGSVKQKIIDIENNIISTFKQRFISYIEERGYSKNIICLIIACKIDKKNRKILNLNLIYNKIIRVDEYIKKNQKKFNDIKNSYKRLNNILIDFKINEVKSIIKKLFQKTILRNKEEEMINLKIKEIKKEIKKAEKEENYELCLNLLYEIIPLLNQYFENNLIKTDNTKETNNRLFLLFRVKSIFDNFLNFNSL